VCEAHRGWITARLAAEPNLTLRALEGERKARGSKAGSFAIRNIVANSGLRSNLHASD
jgi:hypothetical protein